jgi:hypothetical protein
MQNLLVSKRFLKDLLAPFKDLPTNSFTIIDVGTEVEFRWKGGVNSTT